MLDRLAGRGGDALLYAGSAALGLGLAAATSYHGHRLWGVVAAAGYAAGAIASLLIADRLRMPLAAAVFALTGLLPLAVLLVQRAAGVPWSAQPEVVVVERSASLLLEHGTPYADLTALGRAPHFEDYTPYLPGMSVFGLPRALAGANVLTDARVAFAVASAVLVVAAVATLRVRAPGRAPKNSALESSAWPHPPVRAVQLVAVLPATTLTLATGGDDLPVLALLLLALALAHAGRPLAAGVAGGLALGMKLTAAPVLVVLAVYLLVGAGRRVAGLFAAVALAVATAVVLPVALAGPDQLVEHVLRFPAGLTDVESPAASPLPGHLIAQFGPAGRAMALALLAVAALAIMVWLVRRPPRDGAQAAARAAVALLVAMLLMPATRFGYLLYPVALAGAAVALRSAAPARRVPASQEVEPGTL